MSFRRGSWQSQDLAEGEPSRTELQNLLKEHTRYLIEDAWPQQRKGIVPVDESHRICTRTPCGNSTHSTRIEGHGFTVSLPPAILWYTVAVGALINMILLWLFDLRPNAHWILGGLISFYLGTVIAVIALMDRPYRGELGLSPEAFQLIYHGVMHQERGHVRESANGT